MSLRIDALVDGDYISEVVPDIYITVDKYRLDIDYEYDTYKDVESVVIIGAYKLKVPDKYNVIREFSISRNDKLVVINHKGYLVVSINGEIEIKLCRPDGFIKLY